MKALKPMIVAIFAVAFALTTLSTNIAPGKAALQGPNEKFNPRGVLDDEGPPDSGVDREGVTEAPTGFDDRTNGFNVQGPPFDSIDEDNVVPLRSFNDNRFIFEEAETIEDGLGPTYNAQGCRECHQNVVTGGASQITEPPHRAPQKQPIL